MRRLVPEQASQILMQRLIDGGLPAYTYTGPDGQPHVHAGPPTLHNAGTDIVVIPTAGACTFVSEWGNRIGDTRHLAGVVKHVLWLFGRPSRARR